MLSTEKKIKIQQNKKHGQQAYMFNGMHIISIELNEEFIPSNYMDKEQVDTLIEASRTSRSDGRSRWEPSKNSETENNTRDLLISEVIPRKPN